MRIMKEYLKTLDLTEEKIDKLVKFSLDVIEANKSFNLTAITDEKEFAYKHIVDSLAPLQFIEDLTNKNLKIIDVGTGAGFPGIPLAIACPNCKFTLTDALAKRLNFIDEEINKLGLKNVTTVHARAEDLAHDMEYREQYDVVVSRAVANLSTLLEYDIPFIHKNGILIGYKSSEVDDELIQAKHALDELNALYSCGFAYSLPEHMGDRKLLVFKKLSTTCEKYPRKAGTPSKKPL